MPNQDYEKSDIVNALHQLGIKKGDNIFVHSNIGFFGKLQGAEDGETFYKIFKEAIFEVIGTEGTLVVPTFSYSFFKKQKFDAKKTAGVCGLLSEQVRKDSESIRTDDANFSVAAIGARAREFTMNASSHSFGHDSFWDRFYKTGGKFCNFNFDSGSTFIHYVEKKLKVKYRYDKPFQGVKIKDEGEWNSIQWHFTYDLAKPEHEADFVKFDQKAKQLGLAKSVKLGKGTILCISAKDTYSLIEQELQKNPAFLVKSNNLNLNTTVSETGDKMLSLMGELYPICRSITGDGVRESLKIIKKKIPINIVEVATGTEVFDWKVPKEWNIRDGWIKGPDGKKHAEFKKSNLHILNYSCPIKAKMDLVELRSHIFTLPDQPEAIPYLTSYYKESWGFCMSQNELNSLANGEYDILIDSELKEGSLTYGELLIPGKTNEEILLTCYVCHPSICNDNLSGVVLLTFLSKLILELKNNHHFSYRILFIPETIGAIAWLSLNETKLKNIKHGLVATCCGDAGEFTYKKSRQNDAEIDNIVQKTLADSEVAYKVVDFFPSGSDERQFSSPAFNLPMGSLMRTMYGRFPEYHTSLDNLNFMSSRKFGESLEMYWKIINVIEGKIKLRGEEKYLNLNPKCEPQLGRRGLYDQIGGHKKRELDGLAIFWLLNQSDGKNSLLDICVRSGIQFSKLHEAAEALVEVRLLKLL